MITALDRQMLRLALDEAEQGFAAGGFPVGAVLAVDGQVVARGHNQNAQLKDPTAHGEMVCLRGADGAAFERATLYTTLSPCIMCSGAVLWLQVARVVIGEAENFSGHEQFLRDHGVDVQIADDPACKDLFRRFLAERPAHGFKV